ncbi:MAG TPA: VWA domain-containing protein [Vicinamibacterales bacterium]|nr:VWA domain-containing protein [Vicinamibacterales bacterium]
MTPLRRRAALLMLAAGLVCAPAGGARSAPAQDTPQATFRSTAAAVMVDVAVRDRNRRSITGLGADDFEVFDNGVLQTVADVSYGRLPIDVTVALDVSSSVTGDVLKRLREAMVQLTRDLGRGDRLKLVLFNQQITRTTDFTTDVKVVERAVREVAAGGSTALLDAMSVALVSASAPDRRQLVMVFTDGSDSSSITTADMLTTVAQRTRATLAFVVPGALRTITTFSSPKSVLPPVPITQRSASIPQNPLLTSLAAETGGTVIPTAAGVDVSAAFRRVLDEFRSAYVLYYTPAGVDRAGYHKLDVKVKREAVTVQARRGYFGS